MCWSCLTHLCARHHAEASHTSLQLHLALSSNIVVLVVLVIAVDGEVPEDLCVIIFDYFFWFYPPVFTVLMVVLSTYGPVCY